MISDGSNITSRYLTRSCSGFHDVGSWKVGAALSAKSSLKKVNVFLYLSVPVISTLIFGSGDHPLSFAICTSVPPVMSCLWKVSHLISHVASSYRSASLLDHFFHTSMSHPSSLRAIPTLSHSWYESDAGSMYSSNSSIFSILPPYFYINSGL